MSRRHVRSSTLARQNRAVLPYLLLLAFMTASMTYYVMCQWEMYERSAAAQSYAEWPYQASDDDVRIVSTVTAEGKTGGLIAGDQVLTFDGRPFTGRNQILSTLNGSDTARLHPGDTLRLQVRSEAGAGKGVLRDIAIVLLARKAPTRANVIFAIFLQSLPPLICLLIGYWVAWARPRDWNAWLLLSLMTLVEVTFYRPNWFSGAWLVLLGIWYMSFQVLGPLALLLFGIYFPERWRADKRVPGVKWLLIVPIVLGLPTILGIEWVQTFDANVWTPRLALLQGWLDNLLNPLNLACVLLYGAAVIDKLRSATTADARRRMRVLCTGAVIGLGSLLLCFVLLPHFVKNPDTGVLRTIRVAGSVLTLVFPFSLAYVVLVQRALDVGILLRMGTRYALARATIVAVEIGIVLFVLTKFILPFFAREQDWRIALPVTFLLVGAVSSLFAARNGLAQRLQRWLDRKFFREAYDAEVVLSELSEQARGFTETGPLIETISRRISEVLHVAEVGVFLRLGNGFRLQQASGLQQRAGGGLEQVPLTLDEQSSTIRNLARSRQPATLYREDPDGWFLLADAKERATLDALGTELLLPLPGRDRLLGMITLGAKKSQEAYSPADLRLLQSVSTQAGLALEISELVRTLAHQAAARERIDREIEVAREVQERLFPQEIPEFRGLTLAGFCRPAQGVGGDYYDFIRMEDGLDPKTGKPVENGRLGLAIGDISGKGISAALLMASLRASLRGVTMDDSSDLGQVMQKVNRLVYEASATNRYATFFFGVFEPETRLLRYVNAGHNAPILVRQSKRPGGGSEDRSTLLLEGGGPVVGLLSEATYEAQEVTLEPGDLLLGYTDGISEAMTHADEEWGEERMTASASGSIGLDATAILQCIFDAADAFTAGAPQHDDMTLLLMKLES